MSASSFKVAECFKKETLTHVFLCKFHKIFKKCFVEAVLRTSTKVYFWNRATFQATSSPFLKESVVFNCLNIKNNKTWHFLIQPPLISFTMMLVRHISITNLLKKSNRGSWGHGILKGIEKSKQKFQNQLKNKLVL